MAANTKDNVVTKGKIHDEILAWAKANRTSEEEIFDHRITNVYDNRYRVSLYSRHFPGENKVVPDFKITDSWFIHYVDGDVVDRTVYRPSALND